MPDIPKKKTGVAFQAGGQAAVVAPVEQVGPGIISDSFAEKFGGMIIERAEDQQKQMNDNSVNSGNTSYQERLISVMDGERSRLGKDTEGNSDRYQQQSKLIRDEIIKEANPVVRARLQEKFAAVDLKNVTELSKLRSKGLFDEREANHLNAQEIAKKDVLNNPMSSLFQIANRTEMYDQEVENGTMDRDTADENIRIMADDLATAALVSIGEQFGPEAQLNAIDSHAFDKVVSADKLEEMRTQAEKLRDDIKKQKTIDENKARTDAERKYEESVKATENDFSIRTNPDSDNPLTWMDIEKSNLPPTADGPGSGKQYWKERVEKLSNGELLKTNFEVFNAIRTDLYTENIRNWNPAKINDQVRPDGIAIGGKGSEAGAIELINEYESLTSKTKEKNPKLGIVLKEVKSAADAGIFVKDYDPDNEADRQDNVVVHAAIVERITERVNKGEDAGEVFLSEMKPYRIEKSKGLLDSFFFKALGFSTFGGAGVAVGEALKSKAEKDTDHVLVGQRAGVYKVDDKTVKWDGTKVIE